jgi:hypothetical protein
MPYFRLTRRFCDNHSPAWNAMKWHACIYLQNCIFILMYSNGVPYIAIWVFSQPLNIPVHQFTLNLWQHSHWERKSSLCKNPHECIWPNGPHYMLLAGCQNEWAIKQITLKCENWTSLHKSQQFSFFIREVCEVYTKSQNISFIRYMKGMYLGMSIYLGVCVPLIKILWWRKITKTERGGKEGPLAFVGSK